MDFTDPTRPEQLAYYRAAPGDPERRSNPWASYWYDGFVYANNMSPDLDGFMTERGFDVFAVDDPAFDDAVAMTRFNFGTQECLGPPHGLAHGALSTCVEDEAGLLDAP